MNHTPGPWKDDSMLFGAGWRCVVNLPGGRSIDIADPRNRNTGEEDRANAALIAAAPDLFKALCLVMSVHGGTSGGINRCNCDPCKMGRAAIAKATAQGTVNI